MQTAAGQPETASTEGDQHIAVPQQPERTSSDARPVLGVGEELIPLESLLSQVGLKDKDEEDEADADPPAPKELFRTSVHECGICMDRWASPTLRRFYISIASGGLIS